MIFIHFSDGNGKKCRTKDAFSFKLFTEWTNNKAHMEGAGNKFYKGEWDVFSARELRKQFSIYLLQGLDILPRIEYNFIPQCRDRIAGNDFVYNSFSSNAERRHKHFKAFLACCNPMIKSPSKEDFPNWKIRPFIQWLNYQCPRAWHLGCSVSVGKITMPLKGHHRDRLCIT